MYRRPLFLRHRVDVEVSIRHAVRSGRVVSAGETTTTSTAWRRCHVPARGRRDFRHHGCATIPLSGSFHAPTAWDNHRQRHPRASRRCQGDDTSHLSLLQQQAEMMMMRKTNEVHDLLGTCSDWRRAKSTSAIRRRSTCETQRPLELLSNNHRTTSVLRLSPAQFLNVCNTAISQSAHQGTQRYSVTSFHFSMYPSDGLASANDPLAVLRLQLGTLCLLLSPTVMWHTLYI